VEDFYQNILKLSTIILLEVTRWKERQSTACEARCDEDFWDCGEIVLGSRRVRRLQS
jgi:hypothetical protein